MVHFANDKGASLIAHFGLLFLRLTAGGMMFFFHGWSKIANYSAILNRGFPDPLGMGSNVSLALAGFAEGVCAILVMLGFMTRVACIPLIVTMAVAALVVHGADPWKTKEVAVIYGVCFVTLFLTGPGDMAVDRWINFQRKSGF